MAYFTNNVDPISTPFGRKPIPRGRAQYLVSFLDAISIPMTAVCKVVFEFTTLIYGVTFVQGQSSARQ